MDVTADLWTTLTEGETMPATVAVTGAPGQLPSRFAVEDAAVACISVALLAAADLHRVRGAAIHDISLDHTHVAAAVRSEQYYRRSGEPAGMRFAPLSRFWPTSDGWLRTHANYPWHKDALLRALGVGERSEAVADAIARRTSADVERSVFEAGGIAAAVRNSDTWRAHEQGRAVAAESLIARERHGTAPRRALPAGDLPASGLRVLDLTRVIAGPVCTRFLGALGADVVRIDPPHRPDMTAGVVADTLLGKRSAFLDLRDAAGQATLRHLLDEADAVVCGYRPGALEALGLDVASLASRPRGLAIVYLDAWGHRGPWRERRGFDSIVQAAAGIAIAEGSPEEPGALPCQLLDHGTGYLAAAAALHAWRRQYEEGGTHVCRLSLARTATWLTSIPRREVPATAPVASIDGGLVELDSGQGTVTAVAPPGAFDGAPLQWPQPLARYGADPAEWARP